MRIDVKDKPLNEVFLDLKNQYQAQFSFNNEVLSNCSVNSTKEFKDLDEAVFELAANCRFSVKKINDVFIIIKNDKLYSLVGYVKDAKTALPIANVAIKMGDAGTITTKDGYFFLVTNDSLANVEISHIAYQAQVLQLNTNIDHQIELVSKNIKLGEVVIGLGQSDISSENTDEISGRRRVQARLFLNMNDLLDNRPADEITTFVKERDQGLNITYYKLDVSKEKGREIGKVFSFSDETGFYINPRKPKLRKRANFFEADTIGEFIHFITIARMRVAGNVIPYRAEKLLHKRTGKVIGLTRIVLRKLIADDEQLLEMFNNEKGKSAKLASYLKEYYLRKKM